MNIQRLNSLIHKEFIQIIRDPSAIGIAFIMPIVLLFLFGYGVSLDSYHLPVGTVIDTPTLATDSFTAKLQESKFFSIKKYPNFAAAEQAVTNREIKAIIWLRNDFTRQFFAENTVPIGIFINGVNTNEANILTGYLQGVWQTWLQQYTEEKHLGLQAPIESQYRIWFNPALRSRDYLVPGLIAIIMTLIGSLLTALVVAREWERGTMEALMATPVTQGEILLGKLIPYFILGMGGMLVSVFMAITLFSVPLIGSFWALICCSALFLLTALGVGLLISNIARNQFVASQIAIVVTFLPAFILSGFLFDIRSMPFAIQIITHIIPARYFVNILQTVFLAGNIWSILLGNALALLLMTLFFWSLTVLRSNKRLD